MRGGSFRGGTIGAAAKRGQVVQRAIGRKVKLDGHTFDSFGEARRYEALKLMLIAGSIEWLKVHPRYPLEVNSILIATYVADFEYIERRTGARVIEDYKEWTVKTSTRATMVAGKLRYRKSKNPDWKVAELKIKLLEALTGARVVIINGAGGAS